MVKKSDKKSNKKKNNKSTVKTSTLKKKSSTNDPLARKHSESRVYPDEEQGISPLKTSLQKQEEMETGDADEDLDTTVGREKQVEEDEIEPWEAGFSEGASEEGIHGKDALTGEPLMGAENVIETEIEGKNYRFASEKNAEKFLERVKKEKTKKL